MSDGNNIEVSVFCTAYNQEKFIAKCLDGFVSQRTDFRFEVLVHDDRSTDGTLDIILDYERRYPDLFMVITEEENQYSKGVDITREIMAPLAHGRYVAYCEGDDYWCDEEKLQKQYDFMESHPECAMCCHNTIKHDLAGLTADEPFSDWTEIHKMTEDEVFMGWLVHTSSYFHRIEDVWYPDGESIYQFGDYVMLCNLFDKGDIYVLPEIMSVYDLNNISGVTLQTAADTKKVIDSSHDRIHFLEEYDQVTEGRHHDVVMKRILSQMYGEANYLKDV